VSTPTATLPHQGGGRLHEWGLFILKAWFPLFEESSYSLLKILGLVNLSIQLRILLQSLLIRVLKSLKHRSFCKMEGCRSFCNLPSPRLMLHPSISREKQRGSATPSFLYLLYHTFFRFKLFVEERDTLMHKKLIFLISTSIIS